MSARHYFFCLYREEINIGNVCKSVAASGGARYCCNAFRVEGGPTTMAMIVHVLADR